MIDSMSNDDNFQVWLSQTAPDPTVEVQDLITC